MLVNLYNLSCTPGFRPARSRTGWKPARRPEVLRGLRATRSLGDADENREHLIETLKG